MMTPGGIGGQVPPKTHKTESSNQAGAPGPIKSPEGQFSQHAMKWFQEAGTAFKEWIASALSNLGLQDAVSELFPQKPSAERDFVKVKGNMPYGNLDVSQMADSEKIKKVLTLNINSDLSNITKNAIEKLSKNPPEMAQEYGKQVIDLIKANRPFDDAMKAALLKNIDTAFRSNPALQRQLKNYVNQE